MKNNSYKKPYNNNTRNSQPKSKRNSIEATLVMPVDLDDDLYDEILNVLASAPFDKISYPLSAQRYLWDSSVTDETKLITVGYIQKYNSTDATFSVVIFNNFYEDIATWVPTIQLSFITKRDGSLGTITKINLVPGAPEKEAEPVDEAYLTTEADNIELEE